MWPATWPGMGATGASTCLTQPWPTTAGHTRGCGAPKIHHVPIVPGQCQKVPAQHAAHPAQARETGGDGGLPGPNQCATKLRAVASYDSMVVRATDGSETLLKHALPVPRGSAEPKARLTRPPVPLAIRQLRDFNPGPAAPP